MAAFRETKLVQPEPQNLRGNLPMIGSHDEAIKELVVAIRQPMAPPDLPKNEMGFHIIREPAKEQTNLVANSGSLEVSDQSICVHREPTTSRSVPMVP